MTEFGIEHAQAYSGVLGGSRVRGEMLGKDGRRDLIQCPSSFLNLAAPGTGLALSQILRSSQCMIPASSPASESGVPRSCSR
jgi:hypothetical protein